MIVRQCNVCGALDDLDSGVIGSGKFLVFTSRPHPFAFLSEKAGQVLGHQEYDLCRECAATFVAVMQAHSERARAGK